MEGRSSLAYGVPTETEFFGEAHNAIHGGPNLGGRLERLTDARGEHDQESRLGLAWRPTGPGALTSSKNRI
jgi:hypothetical protein